MAQTQCTTPYSTQTFNFTGGIQTFTVPNGVTQIYVELYGGQGGNGANGTNPNNIGGVGGRGGKVTGYVTVSPGQIYNIFVGGQGATPTGGFNGGGNGGTQNAGGGGGATDIRYPGTGTTDRIIVSGGGGGGGRAGCEGNVFAGGKGGASGTNGQKGGNATTSGGEAGGGFGGQSNGTFGARGIGCAGFLGSDGASGLNTGQGGNGGAGQSCCCFTQGSIPGGGGGGGGYQGAGGGGGGSAGTTGCSGNDKGQGGGGGGGTNFIGTFTTTTIDTAFQTGNGMVVICYCVAPESPIVFSTSTSVCPGAPVSMYTNSLLNSATNWNWYTDSCGGTPVATGDSIVVNPTVTTTYYVRAEGGCVQGACQLYTILVTPAVPVIIASGPTTFCQGDSIMLDAGSFTSYSWSTGATTQTINVNTSGTYSVVVTNANGCTGATSQVVTVNPLPTVNINGNTTICSGTNTTLTASGGVTYTWSNNSTTSAITVSPTSTTTYSVVATDANGCTNSSSVTVTVNQSPSVGTTTNVLTITASQNGATYQWINCNGNVAINGATNQSYTATANGQYAVIVTLNGCTDTSACVTINNVSANEVNLTPEQVEVYPNPSNGQFVIDITTFGTANTVVKIMDELGKIVFNQNIEIVNGKNKTNVDLSQLAKGNYYVQVSSAQGLITKKVTIK